MLPLPTSRLSLTKFAVGAVVEGVELGTHPPLILNSGAKELVGFVVMVIWSSSVTVTVCPRMGWKYE